MLQRIMFVVLAWLVASPALAQETIPGTREILELRSDDARCPEGFRCFVAGSDATIRQMLARVNADIDDESRHVTYAQFLDANPCGVIFRRDDGSMRHNGVCSFNRSDEAVSEREFCDGHTCQRWIMASSPGHLNVYRVPAERALTPSERAEQLVRTLNEIDAVTDTVSVPAEFGGMLAAYATLMEEPQPPNRDQDHAVVLAFASAFERTSSASSEPAPDSSRPGTVIEPSEASESDVRERLDALQIADLERRLAAAQELIESRSRIMWGCVLAMAVALLVLMWSLATRKRGVIDMSEAQANGLRAELRSEWSGKLRAVEHDRDNAVARYEAVRTIFGEATKKDSSISEFPTALKTFLERAVNALEKVARPVTPVEVIPTRLQHAWAGAFHGAPLSEEGISSIEEKIERLQRENERLSEPVSVPDYSWLVPEVRDPLFALLREEYGALRHGSRETTDSQRVLEAFSKEKVHKRVTFRELRGVDLNHFVRTTYEALYAVLNRLDRHLGILPAPSGIGTASLVEDPDDTETAELPREGTVMGKPPLAAEPTHPYARVNGDEGRPDERTVRTTIRGVAPNGGRPGE